MVKKMTEEEMLKAVENGSMNWVDVSCEPLTEEFIEKHFDKLDKHCISIYQKLSEEFIEKHFGKLDKCNISIYQKLSETFIDNHFDELDEHWISRYQKLSEEFIEKYFDKLDKYYISIYQKLSEKFLEKHFDKLDKEYISRYQKLSEKFIENHFDELDKYRIPIYQKLSEEFIEKHFDKLDKEYIIRYQYISPEFREKHDLPLPEDSWMYWSRGDKEKYIREYTNYEIKDGKVIAYKSTRKDGYSCFSFHYKYEVGKEYSSHCDCNANEDNSFGLSAWGKEGALKYYSEGKLFLVEIDLDDLGCITSLGKIRCRKLRIIEEVVKG